MDSLSEKLRNWRGRRAMLDSVEVFRVLGNETLHEIAARQPKTKEELLEIKGFKDKKFAKYGAEILNIINGGDGMAVEGMGSLFEMGGTAEAAPKVKRVRKSVTAEIMNLKGGVEELVKVTEERIFTVSDYLDLINVALTDFQAKVVGEISSLDIRGNYLFFGLKDKKDGSTMSCFMWQSNYRMCGVKLEEGLEIIVYGHPNIYKAAGKISMQVETIEHVGEGALKKAYDELKLKLTKEGVFAEEKKRAIPEYPERIGLITSKTGAVIHDFLNNIGKFGYNIKFVDSRVEGQLAVKDLISAVRHFRNEEIDVLVMIRGGGSLESLQAFNNEALIREISTFPKPVICGIGHDKDVPLASLAADMQVSTPTAVTKVLNASWERALQKVEIYKRDMMNIYGNALIERFHSLDRAAHVITQGLVDIFTHFHELEAKLKLSFAKIGFRIKEIAAQVANQAAMIEVNNPERQLKLGYGIVRSGGKIIKSVGAVKIDDIVDIKLSDGSIKSKVIDKKHGFQD